MLLPLLAAALLSQAPTPPSNPPPRPLPRPEPRPMLPRPNQILRPSTATPDAGTATSAPKDPTTSALTCSGTEPFWSLDLSPKSIVYKSPDSKPVTLKPTKPFSASNRMDTWVWQTSAGKEPAQLVLLQQSCSDGMSERQYAFRLLYIRGGTALDGCCNFAEMK